MWCKLCLTVTKTSVRSVFLTDISALAEHLSEQVMMFSIQFFDRVVTRLRFSHTINVEVPSRVAQDPSHGDPKVTFLWPS